MPRGRGKSATLPRPEHEEAVQQAGRPDMNYVEERPIKAGEPLPATTEPTKVTVRLTPKSVADLEQASKIVGLNRTDTINRAIQLYRFINEVLEESKENALLIVRNGKTERIVLR